MFKLLALVVVALLTCIGFAIAQGVYQPGTTPLPTVAGSERVQVGNGGPVITTVSTAQLRDAGGYTIAAPVSGATVQAMNNGSILGLYPAAALAALTVSLPTAPFDGQRVQVFTSQQITALTLVAPTGSIAAAGLPTTLGAGGSIEYFWVASTQTWNRIQ